jgi:hypothetical protein
MKIHPEIKPNPPILHRIPHLCQRKTFLPEQPSFAAANPTLTTTQAFFAWRSISAFTLALVSVDTALGLLL